MNQALAFKAPLTTKQQSTRQQSEGWQANLDVHFCRKPSQTVMTHIEHRGPLRIQRPFYPEGPVCHVYLLHPPGGMVAGDNLAIDLNLQAQSEALITTPAAGKLYRVLDSAEPQFQGVQATLAEGSALEWLPQETILFNGARGELLNRFDLAESANLIGWDIVCLGRRASGEQFETGRVSQRIEIYRAGKPLFLDRVLFEGSSAMLQSPWGMNACPVSGTLFMVMPNSAGPESKIRPDLDALRDKLPGSDQRCQWGLSLRRDVLLVRYLGGSAEQCRQGFELIWRELRPILLSRAVHRPRIWNT